MAIHPRKAEGRSSTLAGDGDVQVTATDVDVPRLWPGSPPAAKVREDAIVFGEVLSVERRAQEKGEKGPGEFRRLCEPDSCARVGLGRQG